MPPHLTTRLRRLALALSAAAALAPAAPAAPAAAEEPTPQAINAHAEFLAYPTTPPPPAPVKVCVVDTGVDLTTDAASAVVERYSEFGGTVDDTGGGGIAKHGTYVAGVIASQWDGVGSVGPVARDRRTIVARGSVAPGATGRVAVNAAARINGRTRTMTRHATIRRRRYAIRLRLPSSAWHIATVTVRFAGDAAHDPARVVRRVSQRRR